MLSKLYDITIKINGKLIYSVQKKRFVQQKESGHSLNPLYSETVHFCTALLSYGSIFYTIVFINLKLFDFSFFL